MNFEGIPIHYDRDVPHNTAYLVNTQWMRSHTLMATRRLCFFYFLLGRKSPTGLDQVMEDLR